MNDIIDWNSCKEEFIKEVEPDPSKINAIVWAAELRLKFIKEVSVNQNNVSFVVEGYYEVTKELLIALLLSKGLRSKNHQCLISYFYYKYPDYEAESYLISQMSYLRNRLGYYGEPIEIDFYKKNKEKFENVIQLLRSLIKKA